MWSAAALALIVLLGGYLRLARLDLMEFKEDEWMMHSAAVEQAQGDLKLRGLLSSVAVPNPPVAVYLFSLPALLSADPVIMAALPALLNTLALIVGYLLARMWMSRPAALLAMLLFAVSPWAVLESRKIWAQDILPLFVTCFFLFTVYYFRSGRSSVLIGILALLSLLNQIHYGTFAFWPVVVFLVIARRSTFRVLPHVLALGVYAVLWLPFAVFVAYGGLAVVTPNTQVIAGPARFVSNLVSAITWHVSLMGHVSFDNASGYASHYFRPASMAFDWSGIVLCMLFLGGVVATIRRSLREESLWILVLWLALPTVLLSLSKFEFHYMLACYPASFLMAGVFLDSAAAWWRRMLSLPALRRVILGVFVSIILLIAAGEAVFFEMFLDHVSLCGGTLGDYGVPYRDKLAVARYFVERFPRESFTLMDLTSQHRTESSYYYLYRLSGGRGALLPLQVEEGRVVAPVYAVLPPDGESELDRPGGMFVCVGTVGVGPLRVVELRPVEKAGILNSRPDGSLNLR